MRQIPVRELNQHTADVLARVAMGERMQITPQRPAGGRHRAC